MSRIATDCPEMPRGKADIYLGHNSSYMCLIEFQEICCCMYVHVHSCSPSVAPFRKTCMLPFYCCASYSLTHSLCPSSLFTAMLPTLSLSLSHSPSLPAPIRYTCPLFLYHSFVMHLGIAHYAIAGPYNNYLRSHDRWDVRTLSRADITTSKNPSLPNPLRYTCPLFLCLPFFAPAFGHNINWHCTLTGLCNNHLRSCIYMAIGTYMCTLLNA